MAGQEVAVMMRRLRSSPAARAGVLVSSAAMLATLAGLPGAPAWARPAGAGQGAPRTSTTAPGTNLLLNPGAQTGAVSAHGWDSVTIPGWQVVSGLPTAVRYGTQRFPPATGRWPMMPGGQLFAGGAGGTARLRQLVWLAPAPRSATGTGLVAGSGSHAATMRYDLSAWLGGTSHSSAAVSVAFLSATGHVLGRSTVGPVGKGGGGHRMSPRTATGTVPPGAVSARVTLILATTLTNIDGPYAPKVGYDYALADGLRFSVSAPVRRPPPLVPPAAHVPGYQHVFLFYFENEDFGSVIGNTAQAPYLNSLVPRGSLLADSFAEEHPSDGNYLALAGGSTFGVPLTNPLEINPRYTIPARNISDLLGTAHQTWKEYLQSANGPCDDTVHGYYWNDDLPMTYFADVRDRPAFCSAHLVPLQALRTDLASAATTPNFAWLGANDCADMEGCGIRAGDEFLAGELGAIERSPAWRTQRSLAIITFDEDGFDHEHPAQRVATLILGSRGVRQGYVSHVRYTHYSLLRTIEAALGLGTLTPNDRYAQPVNDVFGRQPAPPAPATALRAAPRTRARAQAAARRAAISPGAAAAPGGARHPTAFVVNSASATVTPVDLTTRRAGPPIPVGARPQAIAITPDGRTAYVANSGSGTVTPIDTATRRAGTPTGPAPGRWPSRSPRTGAPPTWPTPAQAPSLPSTPPPAGPGRRSGPAWARGASRSARTAAPRTCSTGAARRSPRSTPPPPAPGRRSGWAATRSRWRSPRTAAPPTSPVTAPTRSRRSTWPPGEPATPSPQARRPTRSPSARTAAPSTRSAATPAR